MSIREDCLSSQQRTRPTVLGVRLRCPTRSYGGVECSKRADFINIDLLAQPAPAEVMKAGAACELLWAVCTGERARSSHISARAGGEAQYRRAPWGGTVNRA